MEKVRISRNLVGKQTVLQFLKGKISYLLSRNRYIAISYLIHGY